MRVLSNHDRILLRRMQCGMRVQERLRPAHCIPAACKKGKTEGEKFGRHAVRVWQALQVCVQSELSQEDVRQSDSAAPTTRKPDADSSA